MIPYAAGIFFNDMRHQSEVVFNQNIACLHVTLQATQQILLLLFGFKRLWKRIPVCDIGKQQGYRVQALQQQLQHGKVPFRIKIMLYYPYAWFAAQLQVPPFCFKISAWVSTLPLVSATSSL